MPAYYGKTSGMTLAEYYSFLFDYNCRVKNKLSDEEIALKVLQEFPHRRTILKHVRVKDVSRYRSSYNSGSLHKRFYAPRIPCFRYINNVAVSPRSRTPLYPWEVRKAILLQKKRWKKDCIRKLKEEAKPPRHISIKRGVKKAWKAVKQRIKLQKEMAKLHGCSPWAE
jgi:hypothetical protein